MKSPRSCLPSFLNCAWHSHKASFGVGARVRTTGRKRVGKKIEVVCVTTVPPDGFLHTRYLCKRLRGQFPELRIVAAVLVRDEARDVRKRELLA